MGREGLGIIAAAVVVWIIGILFLVQMCAPEPEEDSEPYLEPTVEETTMQEETVEETVLPDTGGP